MYYSVKEYGRKEGRKEQSVEKTRRVCTVQEV